jgi:hypothetical protein
MRQRDKEEKDLDAKKVSSVQDDPNPKAATQPPRERSPRTKSSVKSVRSSSAVLRLGATPSRSVSVFEALGKVNGQWVRLGMDTLAGVSCVGRADLSKEEQTLAVPTSERLHHAGGESLRTNMEVTLAVDIMGTVFDVTST